MQDIIVPLLNKDAAEIVHKNWQAVDEVPYQLGKVEKMVEKYAAICGTPDFEGKIKSAMLLMCGDHGIAKYRHCQIRRQRLSAGSYHADD